MTRVQLIDQAFGSLCRRQHTGGMTTTKTTFAAFIHHRRLELGLSLEEVARACHLLPASLASLEAGRRQIDSLKLGYLADVLQVAPRQLHQLAMNELASGEFLPLFSADEQ